MLCLPRAFSRISRRIMSSIASSSAASASSLAASAVPAAAAAGSMRAARIWSSVEGDIVAHSRALLLDSAAPSGDFADIETVYARWRERTATVDQIIDQCGLEYLRRLPRKPDHEYGPLHERLRTKKFSKGEAEIIDAASDATSASSSASQSSDSISSSASVAEADAPETNPEFNAERQRIFAGHKLLTRLQSQIESGVCAMCWLTVQCCACARMDERIAALRNRLAPAQPLPAPTVKFVVVMHHFEFMRASNTGKILLRAFPNAELLVMPVPEHERRLTELAMQPHTIALFPSAESVTIDTYLASVGSPLPPADDVRDARLLSALARYIPAASLPAPAQPSAASSASQTSNAPATSSSSASQVSSSPPPLTVLLFDATWTQARRLMDSIPPSALPPHVRVTPRWPSIFAPLRRQVWLSSRRS